jgi:O-antigen/teichoic acid export membrane protein
MVVAVAVPVAGARAVLVGLLVSGTIAVGTQQFVLRSRLRFNAASTQLAAFGLLAVIAAGVLAIDADADFGTAAALYGGALLAALLVGVGLSPPPPPRADIGETRRLASIGFPIMLAGLVFSLFVTLDRWMAISLLGPQRAAPYALASLLAAAMLVIPSVVSQQTYPRMAIARGQGAPARSLRGMARHQGLLAAALVAPVAIGVALFAWIGIPLLLPAYVGAVPAVIVLAGGFLVLAYLTGYGNYLNVVGGQWRYLASQVAGVGSALVLMFVAGLFLGLVGIALGMSAGHVVYGVVLREVALRTEPTEDAAEGRT